MPVVENPPKEEPVSVETSALAQPIPKKIVLAPPFFSVPKEDKVSVKDSVTSRLPAHRLMNGMEASGLDGRPATPQFKFTWGHAAEDGSTDGVGKRHLFYQKQKKGSDRCIQW